MTCRHTAVPAAALLASVLVFSGCAAGRRGEVDKLPRGTVTSIPVIGATAASVAASSPSYTFSAGDEFDLRVPDAPQFDQTLRVRPDGKVSLALIGTVQALGRTPEEVQAEMYQRLQRLAAPGTEAQQYLLQPNDEIELKFPFHSALNEVVKLRPDGKIQLQLIGTVQAAGLSPEGLRDALMTRYVKVLKTPDLAVVLRTATTQNVKVAGGTARAGLLNLQPTVIVRSSQPLQVFVGGEVLRPGVLAYRPGLTLIQAIVESGGYLPTGEISRLVVLRRTADNRADILRPDVGRDLNNAQKADVALQPFDVILLPKTSVAGLADTLNQYLFNLVPFAKNSSFGFSYNLRSNQLN